MTDEAAQRAAVIAEARKWLGTPYAHYASIRGVGVDCAFLLIEVYSAVGLIEHFTPAFYTTDIMLHRNDEEYLGQVLARSHQVSSPKPGDVMLFKLGRIYAHGGIVTVVEPLTIVHAFLPVGIVLEEDITKNAQLAVRRREAIFASYWP